MQSSKGYYVKGCSRTTIPRGIIGVSTVAHDASTGGPCVPGRPQSLSRVTTSHSIRSWAGWSPIQTISHGDADSFWEWLEDESWSLQKVHLFASSAADSLTLLRFWARLEAATVRFGTPRKLNAQGAVNSGSITCVTIHRNIQTQKVTITDYSRFGRRYVWTSLLQYLPMTDREIAKMVGYVEYDSETQEPDSQGEDWKPKNPSALVVRAMQHVAAWWKGHKGGPWAPSIGSLAARFLRSRLPARTLCTHRHDECLSLERAACFGGRVSCWYVGTVAPRISICSIPDGMPLRGSGRVVDSPVYSVDVRSMYPHLLATNRYPVKLIGYERNPTIQDVDCLLRYLCVIARVSLNTDQAEYPYRSYRDVYYPTGSFNTVLCGPELAHAIRHGYVVRIHYAALYQAGTPFAGAALELLACRERARGDGKPGDAGMVKLLANALTGNLAQRRTTWEPCVGSIPPCDEEGNRIQWGGWITSGPDRQWIPSSDPRYDVMGDEVEKYWPRVVTRYRAVAGLVERLERATVGTGTLQACYAYLTAYGRDLMRAIRSTLPIRSVLLQDTDGLWLTEQGYDTLVESGASLGNLPGELRCEKRISHARIYGPKHYWADGEWTLAGMRDHSVCPDTGVITYRATHNPIRSTPIQAPDTITEYLRQCEMLLIHLHGIQGDDGWITPYYLSEGVKAVGRSLPVGDERS